MCIMHCKNTTCITETPICRITVKIATHIFAAETVTCICAAETSNCITATETVFCIVVTERSTKDSLAGMVPVWDSFIYKKEMKQMSKH